MRNMARHRFLWIICILEHLCVTRIYSHDQLRPLFLIENNTIRYVDAITSLAAYRPTKIESVSYEIGRNDRTTATTRVDCFAQFDQFSTIDYRHFVLLLLLLLKRKSSLLDDWARVRRGEGGK